MTNTSCVNIHLGSGWVKEWPFHYLPKAGDTVYVAEDVYLKVDDMVFDLEDELIRIWLEDPPAPIPADLLTSFGWEEG